MNGVKICELPIFGFGILLPGMGAVGSRTLHPAALLHCPCYLDANCNEFLAEKHKVTQGKGMSFQSGQ